MCSSHGVLRLAGGLALQTTDIVVLWVASGDEYGGTLEDVNVGEVYAQLWSIRRRAAGVRLTGTAHWDLEVMETRIVETLLFACRVSTVRKCRRVPGALSSFGITWPSASGSVSDLI